MECPGSRWIGEAERSQGIGEGEDAFFVVYTRI